MNLLIDLREADSSSRSTDVLLHLADFVITETADIGARLKVAVVAPVQLSFGLARMYEPLPMWSHGISLFLDRPTPRWHGWAHPRIYCE